MKSISAIFLIVMFFLQTFSTYFIQADFFINRSYIAKNLCVNKDKPVMKCNGKCYLSKKLKEQQKSDQQAPVNKNQKVDIQPFLVAGSIVMANGNAIKKILFFNRNDMEMDSFPGTIFHPPIV